MGSPTGRSAICGGAAWTGAGDARLRGEGLRAKASWPAGELGGEAQRGERRCRRAARPELRVPRAACALRSPWLRGEEATPARWRWRPWLAGLAQSWRWRPLPARSASAPSPGRSPGSTQCAPAPCAAARTRSILPLQVWRRPPASDVSLLPGEPSPGGPVRSDGEAGGTRGTCNPRLEQPRRRPSGGELSPGTFSRLPAPASARPWRLPPTALASPPARLSPPTPRLPSTCTPPLGRTRPGAPPFPREAQPLTHTITLLLPFSLPTAPMEPKQALL